jgi:hypothetical protein
MSLGNRRRGREPFEIVPIKRVDVYESVLAQLNALISESGMQRRIGCRRSGSWWRGSG